MQDRLLCSSKHLWLDAAYNGQDKGKDWAEKALDRTAHDRVPFASKVVPEKVVMKAWAREWAEEGAMIDRERLLPDKDFSPSCRGRWGGGAHLLLIGPENRTG